MKLVFEVMKAQTKLEVGARAGINREKLVALAEEVAADLQRAAEEASPEWGLLKAAIDKLEGKKRR